MAGSVDSPPELITVQGARPDGRVILWERDVHHPGGEAFIAGDNIAVVAETPAVLKLLADARLRRLKG